MCSNTQWRALAKLSKCLGPIGRRKARVNIVVVMSVHSQELPLGGQDWNHGEGCLQIQFGHEGSLVEPAEERHSMLAQCMAI